MMYLSHSSAQSTSHQVAHVRGGHVRPNPPLVFHTPGLLKLGHAARCEWPLPPPSQWPSLIQTGHNIFGNICSAKDIGILYLQSGSLVQRVTYMYNDFSLYSDVRALPLPLLICAHVHVSSSLCTSSLNS